VAFLDGVDYFQHYLCHHAHYHEYYHFTQTHIQECFGGYTYQAYKPEYIHKHFFSLPFLKGGGGLPGYEQTTINQRRQQLVA
jgi:hypothetical protein